MADLTNLDISDFTSVSSVNDSDKVLLVLSDNLNGKIAVGLFKGQIQNAITPSIQDGIGYIGGISQNISAQGKTPELRAGNNGIEWKYTDSDQWAILVPYSSITLSFDDLTYDQKEQLRGYTFQFVIGNVTSGNSAQATLQQTGVATNGSPIYSLSLVLPKGDAFTYDDFTPAQIADLKKPATDAAAVALAAADNANNAANNANTSIGNLSDLTTNDKTSYVNALNEVHSDIYANTNWTRKTSFDLSVLKQAVADGNLEKYGLKVGDQTTINGHTYVIAGLNPMRGTYTPYCVNVNHVGLICIPHTATKWNVSGNTYTGADDRGAGYANSDLHYYLTNTVLPLAETDLGASNILSHFCLLANAINKTGYNRFGSASGCSSNWKWVEEVKIVALSEMQMYGGTIWSSSGYDTGEVCQQLEVFQKYKATAIFGGEYPWLRDIASASNATYAGRQGGARYDTASGARYVAGLILFH